MFPSVLSGVPTLVIVPFTPALEPKVNNPVEFLKSDLLTLIHAEYMIGVFQGCANVWSGLVTGLWALPLPWRRPQTSRRGSPNLHTTLKFAELLL